ncbi:hypothetical protein K438DRAFT_1803269, partial [Mycena galopus ATCC 62051]
MLGTLVAPLLFSGLKVFRATAAELNRIPEIQPRYKPTTSILGAAILRPLQVVGCATRRPYFQAFTQVNGLSRISCFPTQDLLRCPPTSRRFGLVTGRVRFSKHQRPRWGVSGR